MGKVPQKADTFSACTAGVVSHRKHRYHRNFSAYTADNKLNTDRTDIACTANDLISPAEIAEIAEMGLRPKPCGLYSYYLKKEFLQFLQFLRDFLNIK